MSPVKNQGHCGSCWAFSANGALETQTWKHKGRMTVLSEQNLIDCTATYGNHGCHGGYMGLAYEYIERNKGVNTEESYPYEAVRGQCRFKRDSNTIGATIKSFVRFKEHDEKNLQKLVALIGTVSCAVYGSLPTFKHYKGGIYHDKHCLKHPTHAVRII